MELPMARTVIQSWAQEITQPRHPFGCDHCGDAINGRYERLVVRVESRKFPALEVYRRCSECM